MSGLLTETNYIGLDIGVYPHQTASPVQQIINSAAEFSCVVTSEAKVVIVKDD